MFKCNYCFIFALALNAAIWGVIVWRVVYA
jgi:hypothetical protein